MLEIIIIITFQKKKNDFYHYLFIYYGMKPWHGALWYHKSYGKGKIKVIFQLIAKLLKTCLILGCKQIFCLF